LARISTSIGAPSKPIADASVDALGDGFDTAAAERIDSQPLDGCDAIQSSAQWDWLRRPAPDISSVRAFARRREHIAAVSRGRRRRHFSRLDAKLIIVDQNAARRVL
jgi:hypothetical protein